MLPENIANFVKFMINETRNGNVRWSYDSNNDLVSTSYNGMYISLDSAFDHDNGYNFHRLNIIQNEKNFFFPINQYTDGYDLLKTLYLQAQASDFRF